MPMDIFTIIGLAGFAGYVVSYGLLQMGMLDGNGVPYSVANVVAASLVLVSLTSDFNLASAMIQVVWIVIGIVGLTLRVLKRRPTIYSPARSEPAVYDPGDFPETARLYVVSTARSNSLDPVA